MRVLLDTHTFIWLDSTPAKLSAAVTTICKDTSNSLYVSLASVWEMQIKLAMGKLTLTRSLPDTIEWQQQNNLIQILPVTLQHIFALGALPAHHRDPFDRILVVQAQVEGLTVLSKDSEFAQYAVNIIW